MMRRPGGSDFAPGAYVFPGGSVHREDALFEDELRAAAIRELFEEVGILLARTQGRFARAAHAERLRHRLDQGVSWVQALRSLELTPAFDRLALFARWVTPEVIRRRYDTSFYLARVPAGQDVHPHPGEVADWTWIRPQRALDGDLELVHATRRILERAATAGDARRLLAAARRRRAVRVVRPRVVPGPEGSFGLVDEEFDS